MPLRIALILFLLHGLNISVYGFKSVRRPTANIRLRKESSLSKIKEDRQYALHSQSDGGSKTKSNPNNFDAVKEANRRKRRTVYTSYDWKAHRSSKRFVKQLISAPRSFLYRSLKDQVLLVTLNSLFIVLYNKLVERFRFSLPILSCNALPFTLTSFALAMLLVFRTNAAYSRWKDARVAWAKISSKCSNLIRQSLSWFPDKDKSLKNEVLRYVVAYAFVLKWQLRHPHADHRLKDSLNNILHESEITDILAYSHRSQRIAMKLSDVIGRANLLPNIQCHVDKGICELIDAAYVCERIYSTPIPLVYTKHTERVLFMWLLTVPMALYNSLSYKWMLVPVSFMNSLLLFGIEELGIQIEEPFSILALDHICEDIQTIARESKIIIPEILVNQATPAGNISSSLSSNTSSSEASLIAAQDMSTITSVSPVNIDTKKTSSASQRSATTVSGYVPVYDETLEEKSVSSLVSSSGLPAVKPYKHKKESSTQVKERGAAKKQISGVSVMRRVRDEESVGQTERIGKKHAVKERSVLTKKKHVSKKPSSGSSAASTVAGSDMLTLISQPSESCDEEQEDCDGCTLFSPQVTLPSIPFSDLKLQEICDEIMEEKKQIESAATALNVSVARDSSTDLRDKMEANLNLTESLISITTPAVFESVSVSSSLPPARGTHEEFSNFNRVEDSHEPSVERPSQDSYRAVISASTSEAPNSTWHDDDHNLVNRNE